MSIYVFDIDGTISKEGKRVCPAICNRLVALAENNQLIFASARPVRDMLPMLSKKLHSSFFIGCNGGMAWKNGRVVLSYALEIDFVMQMLSVMTHLGIPYVLDGKWNYAFSEKHHPFHDYIRSLSSHEVCEEDIICSGVMKILVLSQEHKQEVLSHTENFGVSMHTHRSDGVYDFTPRGNNKYRTLSELIGGDKYTAFGNDMNDFVMLREAEVSVFIGEREAFSGATYYTTMDYIPTIINDIENNKNT
ncbi:HAD hydrolase family protein [Serratia ficaria]|uniref:HAD hydrolase family protein n=1 Tax=Serratia ficaria TaxID=61651 RepID=UPI0021773387|nr:HAD hydrolase family protein [Serratia ficaria]CAI1125170.1 Soluble P-type ATPase [Serratia ficaria]CAI1540326.1 Soluble P-type ATPase [Serratia ficaria]